MTAVALHVAIMCGLIVLQTVAFPAGLIRGAVPDLALVLLCFSANYHGSFKGEVSGFVSGFVLDALSLAPLGFHAAIRTLIGFLFGTLRGKFFIDPIFMPVLMVAVATLLRGVLAYLFTSLFAPELSVTVFSKQFGIELVMNALPAPFFYALIKSVNMIAPGRDRGEYE